MTWFEDLTGFAEGIASEVAGQFHVDGEYLVSAANGRRMRSGTFETPSLAELRTQASKSATGTGATTVREVVGDVQQLHLDRQNAAALFQVASQFNALEMVGPHVTPEAGVTGYVHDLTQGPACAVACGAGLIYRNYLVPVDGQTGQTADKQINLLADVTLALDVDLKMSNGYALPTAEQLDRINDTLGALSADEYDELLGHMRIGLHRNTEVTIGSASHAVSQAYCSAMPVSYSGLGIERWAPFAKLALDAAYEATLAAAVVNKRSSGHRTVYLTLLGGGAFGNEPAWIYAAIERAMERYASVGLDVAVVSYGYSNPDLAALGTWR